MNTTIPTNVIKIFEYLTALKDLAAPSICDLRAHHEQCWWQADLPNGRGSFWNGSGAHAEAWLEIQQQNLAPAPSPPEPLREWLSEIGGRPEQPPMLQTPLPRIDRSEAAKTADFFEWLEDLQKEEAPSETAPLTFTLADEAEAPERKNGRMEAAFESDPERVALWEHWRYEVWQAWAEGAAAQQSANQFYDTLGILRRRLQRESDEIELMIGEGLLTWDSEQRKIFHPLVIVRADLLFDAEKRSFAIVPVEGSAALALEMLSGIPLADAELLARIESRARINPLDLRDRAALENLFRDLAAAIATASELRLPEILGGSDLLPTSTPAFYNAPVLFVRKRMGTQWQSDFQNIITAIKNGAPAAPSLAALATSAPLAPEESAQEKWRALGENVLFPLPANAEQKEIARRLASQAGVAVQGPPGTGKSHTIVNLIAHLLAHGKRILVTSQTERALRVLGEMLRQWLPEIAPLCVAVLEGETGARGELEATITRIHERLSSFELETAERELQQLEGELQACRENIAQLRAELRRVEEAENNVVCIQGRDLKTMQVAEWLAQHEAGRAWLPDKIPVACEPPLTESEMLRLHELLNTFTYGELAILSQELPALEKLPSAAQIAQYCERVLAYEARAPQREELLRGWTLPLAAPSDLEQKMALADKALRKLESFVAPWLRGILQDVSYGGQREEHWQEFARECRVQLRSIRAAEKALAHYSVTLPLAFDARQDREDLTALYDELSKNKTIGLRFRYGSGKRALRVFTEYKLNGNAPRTAEDLQVLLRSLDLEEDKRKLWALWTNGMRDVGGPAPDSEDEQLLKIIEEYLRMLEPVVGWNNTYLRLLASAAIQIKPYGPAAWHEVEWLKQYREGLRAYAEILASAALYDFANEWTQFLREGLGRERAHAAWANLLAALEARDAKAWEHELQELQRVIALLPELRELEQLQEKLRVAAPRWLMEMEKQISAGASPGPPPQWQDAWEWRRVHSWLDAHLERSNSEELYERLRLAQTQAARLLENVVARSTWLEQAKRTTPEQKAALFAWLKAVQNIGKNEKSKSESHYRAEAAQLVPKCRPAIPVWIMPLEKVLNTFSPADEKFDVIIVDESSQCQLFALSALFRAERAVIIGDHKQVSPEAVGVEPAEVNNLIERHLADLPNANAVLWDLHASLFDKAQEAFTPAGNGLILREHFRCAPEIIQFCNEQFYEGRIEPLRLPGPHERRSPAIATVRVTHEPSSQASNAAVNMMEAEAIADKIVELCGDERYAQHTMGVISLQGMAQAELIANLLHARLSADEISKRRLLCGDAKHFQGDERHVIFLSMVAMPQPRPEPLTNKFAEQRFNVAASRARDQLWLFHSVGLEDLHPQCMRYFLLQHCLLPKQSEQKIQSAIEIFERYGSGAFVREVYRRIVARGFEAAPEVKIGTHPYRIDLVVEGKHARLGVICSGAEWRGPEHWEEELERQMVLERVGWKFWRVAGSAFYHNPEKTLSSLWRKLEELGIKPAQPDDVIDEIFSD